MKKIKIIAAWCFSILLIFAIAPFSGAESIYSSIIRIHVIANSDDEKDQALKLEVRDAILDYVSQNFHGIDNIEEAKTEIIERGAEIIELANKTIAENGFSYSAKIVFGEENYPTRDYISFSLPKGKYISLRVMLGDAAGQNWWCVLFPPVCTNSAADTEKVLSDAGISKQNIKTITKSGKIYEIRFKFMELLSELKEKIAN